MSESAELVVTFIRHEDVIALQVQRDFDVLSERLWRALTRSEDLLQWLAPGAISLEVGGSARLDFGDSGVVIDSLVTAMTPGRLLEYDWSGPDGPSRPLHWEIAPSGEGAHLTLHLRLPASEDAARAAAGWTAHLEMLAAALAEVPICFPFAAFKAAREAYRDPVAIAEAAWTRTADRAANLAAA